MTPNYAYNLLSIYITSPNLNSHTHGLILNNKDSTETFSSPLQ